MRGEIPLFYFIYMNKDNSQDVVKFQMLEIPAGNISFRGYRDENGLTKYFYLQKRGRDGQLVARKVNIPAGTSFLQVRKAEMNADRTMTLADYIEQSSFCEGSEAQIRTGTRPWFKKFQPEKDAKERLDSKRLKYRAIAKMNTIFASEDETVMFGNSLGFFDKDINIVMDKISDYVESDPEGFLEKTSITKEKTNIYALINNCIEADIIGIKHSKWVFKGTDENGDSKDELIMSARSKDKLADHLEKDMDWRHTLEKAYEDAKG